MEHYDKQKLDSIVETRAEAQIRSSDPDFAGRRRRQSNTHKTQQTTPCSSHRGRHAFISTIVSAQVFTALSQASVKTKQLYCYRLRNYHVVETILEELAALNDKKTLL